MTLDLLSVLVGSGGTFVAFALGRANGYAKARRETQLKYVCGCKDHLAEHDPVTGKCKALSDRDHNGKHLPCQCQHYIGPFPTDRPRPPFAELT